MHSFSVAALHPNLVDTAECEQLDDKASTSKYGRSLLRGFLSSPQNGGSPTKKSSESEVKIELDNARLWNQFKDCETEMIITKTGRRMFPTLRYRVTGLDLNTTYAMILELVPVNRGTRYKFAEGGWTTQRDVVGGALQYATQEPHKSIYYHPDSPAPGRLWMKQPVSFHKLKLTNNAAGGMGNVVLNSLHKYEPRLHIVKLHQEASLVSGGLTSSQMVASASFSETQFIAVTAYQNDQIIRLKVNYNPFAKGFRENGKHDRNRRPSYPDWYNTDEPPLKQLRCEVPLTSCTPDYRTTRLPLSASDLSPSDSCCHSCSSDNSSPTFLTTPYNRPNPGEPRNLNSGPINSKLSMGGNGNVATCATPPMTILQTTDDDASPFTAPGIHSQPLRIETQARSRQPNNGYPTLVSHSVSPHTKVPEVLPVPQMYIKSPGLSPITVSKPNTTANWGSPPVTNLGTDIPSDRAVNDVNLLLPANNILAQISSAHGLSPSQLAFPMDPTAALLSCLPFLPYTFPLLPMFPPQVWKALPNVPPPVSSMPFPGVPTPSKLS